MATNNKIKRYGSGATGWVDVIDGDDYLTYATDAAKLVPIAGQTGQVLSKKTNANYDVEWTTHHDVPAAGVIGDVLTKTAGTDYVYAWVPPTNRFGTAAENVEVFPTSDNKLRLTDNTVDGRPYLSFYNQNAAGVLTRKGYIGYPEALTDASSLHIISDLGDLRLTTFTAGKNVLANGDRVLTTADMTSSAGNVVVTGDVKAATFHGGGVGGNAYYVGNDAAIVDVDVANTMAIHGQQNAAIGGLRFGNVGPILSNSGTTLTMTGSLSVDSPAAGVDAIGIGDYYGGAWAAVSSTAGYVLLGNSNNINSPIYLRSKGTGAVHLGTADANDLTIGTDHSVALRVGMGSTLIMNQNNITDGNTVYMDNWYRSTGQTGWYNETQGAGIHCTTDAWVRTYSATGFYSQTGMGGALFSSSGGQALYRETTYGTFYYFTSRRELKERIEPLTNSGAVIDQFRPSSFYWRPTEDDLPEAIEWKSKDQQIGFIAEEVAEVDRGQYATYDKDLIPQAWDTYPVVALLVAEVQSLRVRVAELEALS